MITNHKSTAESQIVPFDWNMCGTCSFSVKIFTFQVRLPHTTSVLILNRSQCTFREQWVSGCPVKEDLVLPCPAGRFKSSGLGTSFPCDGQLLVLACGYINTWPHCKLFNLLNVVCMHVWACIYVGAHTYEDEGTQLCTHMLRLEVEAGCLPWSFLS